MLLSLRSPFSHPFARVGLVVAAAGLSALALGCTDPDASFQDFTNREAAIIAAEPPPDLGGPCPSNDTTKVGESDGDFFFTLSAKINKNKPVVFLTKLTTAAKGAGVEFSMNIQPLMFSDQKTPTGPSADVGPYDINADGSFDAQLPSLDAPGNANPITMTDLVSSVELTGHICGAPLEDFICGAVAGMVTKPLPLNLMGSTFTMQKITDPTKYPTPLLDCAKTKPTM